jgi:hypothetical protein
MKLTTLTAAVAAALVCVQSAQARQHERPGVYFRARHAVYARHEASPQYFGSTASASGYGASTPTVVGRHGRGGRPAAWCGWQMRQLVDSDPGAQFNLARNWAHWGHSGPPGIGAVVVWPHHVGRIVGQQGGRWIIQSGNDGGNRMRTRPRSIGGAIAIRWS